MIKDMPWADGELDAYAAEISERCAARARELGVDVMMKKHFRDDATMAAGLARAKAQPDPTEDEASDSDSDSDSSDDEAARAEKAEKKARKAAEKAAQSGTDVDDGFAVVGKKGQVEKPGAAKPLDVMKAPKEKITYEMVDKKLADLIASRGKKGTDRHENVETLAYVATVAKCAAQEIEALVMLISAQFDISGSMSTHMPIPIWKKCVNNLLRIDALLKQNPQITLVESSEPEPKPSPEDIVAGAPVQLWGSMCAAMAADQEGERRALAAMVRETRGARDLP